MASSPEWRRAAALLLALLVASTAPRAGETPAGLWKTVSDVNGAERSLVRITLQQGELTGRIERIIDPGVPPDARCDRCAGARKGQPLRGLTVLQGVRARPGEPAVWEGGEILDPNDGKTYRVRLTLQPGGAGLEVRGYLGTPWLGRTQVWLRME